VRSAILLAANDDVAAMLDTVATDGAVMVAHLVKRLVAVLAAADNVNPLVRHLAARNSGVVCLPAS